LNLLPSRTAKDETTVALSAVLVLSSRRPPRWLTAEAKAEWRRVALAGAAAAAHARVDARELKISILGWGL
jgi:phage terminase small subunit